MKQVLITGGCGFLAAWIARRLVQRGIRLRLFDLNDTRDTVLRIVGPAHAHLLEWHVGDIRQADQVQAAMQGCDGVVHLAGVLTPTCSANPVLGAQVNLLGSLHVFDAALAHGVRQVVYASSAGVYGPDHADYPAPATHYGAFKLAVEGAARAYWHTQGLASVGFRPFIVYGPGRESGVSAGPSLACRAAAQGQPYVVGYTGAAGLVYVDDVAEAFAHALLVPAQGASVFNLVGQQYTVDAVIAEVCRQVPTAQLRAEGPPLTIAADVGEPGLDAWLPGRQRTSLADGVAATVAYYRAL